MHPGLRIMEVDLNTGCLGMTSTGQALVTSVRERERGRGVFSQRAHCNQWKGGGGEEEGIRRAPRALS